MIRQERLLEMSKTGTSQQMLALFMAISVKLNLNATVLRSNLGLWVGNIS